MFFKISKQHQRWLCTATTLVLLTLGSSAVANADTTSTSISQPVTTAQQLNANSISQAANSTLSLSTTASNTSVQPIVTAQPLRASYAASQNQNATQTDAVDLSWMNANMNTGTFFQMKSQGVKYAIIQLTKGDYMQDPYAAEQVNDATAAGLGVAAYHFTKFNSRQGAINEANYFADRAQQLNLPTNTLMFADVEDQRNEYPGVVNDLRAFFDQLSSRGYWNHGVYTGLWFDRTYPVSTVVGRNRTWIAQYTYDHQATPAQIAAKHAAGYGAWQYTGYNGGYNVAGYGTLDGTIDLGLLSSAIGPSSAAHLDQFELDPVTNSLQVSGWFASNANNSKDSNRYIILLDSHHREIGRQKVNAGSRQDVQRAYPGLYGAGQSGFTSQFSLTNQALRRAISDSEPLTVIFRDSASADGNSNYNDFWFAQRQLSQNVGFVDQFTVNNGVLTVSGWHATDQSLTRPYQWIILYDQTNHQEVARQQVASQARSDVARAYPHVIGAGQSGFSASFNIANYPALSAALLNGDTIQVVARYSCSQSNGEITPVDLWMKSQNFGSANAAWLDNFQISDHLLNVAGWYADDRAAGANHPYIIIFDQSTGHEVAREWIQPILRDDVAKAYPAIYQAGKSGFDTDFNLGQNGSLANAITRGDRLQVVARYSNQNDGEGDYTQHWFDAHAFTANDAFLDNFKYDASKQAITVNGWHCADQAVGRPYHYDILLDATNGHELSRVQSNISQRSDVAKAYPTVYNSASSGFNASFALTPQIQSALASHHRLQLVDRYSAAKDGDSDYVDYWFNSQVLRSY